MALVTRYTHYRVKQVYQDILHTLINGFKLWEAMVNGRGLCSSLAQGR